MRLSPRILLIAAGLLASGSALAHPGHAVSGLAAGLLHPLSGVDHLLAMLGVGLWAGQRGGKALWLLPLSFMLMLAVGGLLGMQGLALPGSESGIAASLLLIGLLIAGGVRLPTWGGMALVGVFALFHGLAHGAELPSAESALSYGIGFTLASGLLHAAGATSSWLSRALPALVRMLGAAIGVTGATLLALG